MMDLSQFGNYEFLRPLVSGWLGKVEAAIGGKDRRRWKELSDECMMFYSRSAAAMWDMGYSRKFWRGVKAPKFRISLNKAFEFVALYGPNLMWDVPHRTATPQKPLELPDLPPQFEQIRQQEFSQNRIVGALMQGWLNYTPRETPGGGLETQNELALIDALVKGRGVLWPSVYQFDGSQRKITGCFRQAPEDVLVDPDFKTVQQAKWIALRHLDTVDDLLARFPGLKREQFQGGKGLESAWHYGESKGKDDKGVSDRKAGKSNDLVLWYEIFSKMGPGSRSTGMPNELKEHLETTVGKYAYLCICPDCPYPLNMPKEFLLSGATDSDVRQRLSWPVPWWRDDAWPMRELDFHLDPDGSYPLPPLAAALGELKFLNFLVPWLCNRIYSSSRDFWAVIGSHFDEYKKYLEDGEDQVVFPIPPGQYDDIKKAVQNLTQPETRADAWKIYELVNEAFDKRMGMTPMLYGLNADNTQNRTAAETNTKWQALGVRQEQMQKKVVAWQGRLATAEAQLAWLFVKARDTQPLLGQAGGALWQQYIENADPELVMRQMQYDISAASIRRPNRDRDVANLTEYLARWIPLMQAYGTMTGDFTVANGASKKWGELHDMDMEGLNFPAKDPNDPQVAMQQQMQQAELQKMMAEAQKLQAEAQHNPAEMKAAELQLKGQIDQQKLAMDMQKTEAELKADIVRLQLEVEAKKSELAMKAQEHRQDMAMQREQGQVDLAIKQAQGAQQIQQGQQQLQQNKEKHVLGLAATHATTKAKVAASKKPKAA
jgi:hypothetical protein